MKRRNFIKLSMTASAGALAVNQAAAGTINWRELSTCDYSDRVLVLVQLHGGNDGINTILPIEQYDLYANLRPDIKIPNTGQNAFINLDSTISSDRQVGLHPAMTGIKDMYDDGLVNLVQAVQYNDQNRSHFRSRDIWFSGIDGTQSNAATNSGWMGRYFEKEFESGLNYPLGVQVGNKKNSRGFSGEHSHDLSINLTGQDPSGYYSIISGLGGEGLTDIPASDYGDKLKHIQDTDEFSNVYGQQISNAFNASNNVTEYPDLDLADQLKTVARLIAGGLKTKIYMVRLKGFDNHNDQVAQDATTTGKHADLLGELSQSVKAFYDDLSALGISDRVLTSTLSDFGRKVKQNGNFGTDHGGAAPMMLFGPAVKAGITGNNVDLSEANSENNWQLQSYQADYRQVFATVLQDWFGTKSETVDHSLIQNSDGLFSNQKMDLLGQSFVADASCHNESILGFDESPLLNAKLDAYPNPVSDFLTIESSHPSTVSVRVFNTTGQEVLRKQMNRVSKVFMLDMSELNTGPYVIKIDSQQHSITKKLMKI